MEFTGEFKKNLFLFNPQFPGCDFKFEIMYLYEKKRVW